MGYRTLARLWALEMSSTDLRFELFSPGGSTVLSDYGPFSWKGVTGGSRCDFEGDCGTLALRASGTDHSDAPNPHSCCCECCCASPVTAPGA